MYQDSFHVRCITSQAKLQTKIWTGLIQPRMIFMRRNSDFVRGGGQSRTYVGAQDCLLHM